MTDDSDVDSVAAVGIDALFVSVMLSFSPLRFQD